MTGSNVVMNEAQLRVTVPMAPIAADGVAAIAPCEVIAPVCVVSSKPVDSVPVATVIVDAAPVVVDVTTNAAR